MPYQTVSYNGITVYYSPDLVGGGEKYGQDYLAQIAERFGTVGRVFEWCAGPGFMGFSLLAHGLCRSLCLADVNPAAVTACRETVRRNGLADRVAVYQSDCFDAIPLAEQWDLAIGNPPHSGTDAVLPWGQSCIYMDAGWALHRRFYRDVARFLSPGASVLIQENADLSTPDTFRPMIAAGGLRFADSFSCPIDPHIYYVWSTLRGAAP
jgi:methylase of polypeptide subunit release factors